jgi:hypothetical protein
LFAQNGLVQTLSKTARHNPILPGDIRPPERS